ncbi:MAG: glycosyltransferase [Methanobacteriaceae archaeon]|nr:glycosyltransferase [Methanobacteriaceae archaeon]
MRNVLLIAYYFHEKENIGSVRLKGLAKNLPRFGWNPVIVTPQSPEKLDPYWDDYDIIEVPYQDLMTQWKRYLGFENHKTVKEQMQTKTYKNKRSWLEKLARVWEEFFTYPDGQKTWYEPVIKRIDNLIDEKEINAVISSALPLTSHIIASTIKYRHGVPWIADFRDLWTQNHYYKYTSVRKFFERRLELKTMKNADIMTTVSEPLVQDLKKLHQKEEVYSIPNGFDPDQINPGTSLSNKFTITYTGQLYRGKRDPEPLFRSLSELSRDGLIDLDEVEVNFYGPLESWLEEESNRLGLESVVKFHGIIPREEVIRKQQESQLLLLLMWDNHSEIGVCTGKLFEYLSAKRPIISQGITEGCVANILHETNTGTAVKTVHEIKEVFLKYYSQYKKMGKVPYQGNEKIYQYSHVNMAREFGKLLNKITSK